MFYLETYGINCYFIIFSARGSTLCFPRAKFCILCSVCLLLKASKYKEAGKLVQDWLSCEDNFSQVKYVKIAEVYVKHILFPQQLHEEIKCFLETNQVIPSSEKQVRSIVSWHCG